MPKILLNGSSMKGAAKNNLMKKSRYQSGRGSIDRFQVTEVDHNPSGRLMKSKSTLRQGNSLESSKIKLDPLTSIFRET